MKKNLLLTLMLSLTTTAALGHEGHDHDAPTTLEAPKGGTIKALELTLVEVVSKGKDLKIYLYDKAMKPQAVAAYAVKATAQPPRGKNSEEVKLAAKGTWFEGSYDAKGLHRYTLVVAIKDPKTGHDDKLNFTVEPRK